MNSSVYAVGLKHYIELRRSQKPPKKKESQLIKISTSTHTFSTWDDNVPSPFGRGDYVRKSREVETKTPIKVLDFVGGRFLCSIKRRSCPVKCGVGEVKLVEPEIAQRLILKWAGPLGRNPHSI